MKTKFLVSLIAVLAVLSVMTLSITSAVETLGIDNLNLEVKGIDNAGDSVSIDAGEVVPVRIVFTAGEDASEVQVKVSIADETAKTGRFVILEDRIYSKLLSVKMPENFDPFENLIFTVEIKGKVGDTEKIFRQEFEVTVQREEFKSEILNVDNEKTVNAGDNLAVDVVLKNRGYDELEDMFVVVSIPELGVSKKAYFEDLSPTDECELSVDGVVVITGEADCNKQDSAERRVYVKIPSNAKAGVYDMKVEAYNSDSSSVVTRKIVVVGSEEESKIVVPASAREIAAGKTVTFDIVIVNSGSKVGIYEIAPETVNGIIVSTDKTVVAVPAGSSAVAKISVTGKTEGVYTFAVNVNSENGLVGKVMLTANVTGKAFTGNLTILTIVLAIVFLVLLVVLIVLLTRKPAKSEELEESYY